MPVLDQIPEDRKFPVICGIGNGDFETQLRQLLAVMDSSTSEPVKVVYLDVNSPAGSDKADLYELDLSNLPVLLIIEDDDTLYKKWSGGSLPDAQTVAYEVQNLTGTVE